MGDAHLIKHFSCQKNGMNEKPLYIFYFEYVGDIFSVPTRLDGMVFDVQSSETELGKCSDCGLRIADCGLRIEEGGLWIAEGGLWIVDCGLRIADCGLWIADCGLRIADCGLRIED